MFTESCKQCTWTTVPKHSQAEAIYALHGHVNRKHGQWAKAREHHPDVAQIIKPKRVYRRKTTAPDPARTEFARIGQAATINFCPGCGFDIRKFTLALTVSERIQ